MTLSRTLDEIPTDELEGELDRRRALLRSGFCDYCKSQIGSEPACRFPDRHAGKEPVE